MDRALILEEKNVALRRGGLTVEERKGWRDKEGPMGRAQKDFFRSKSIIPRVEPSGKELGEGKLLE